MKPNKKYKDTVFSLYWSDPRRLIEIYNAFEGTHFPLDTEVEINTLEDALYKDRINDVSFLLNGELIILVEHQSTLNDNMPLRMLLYLARLYEKYHEQKDSDALYRRKMIQVPTPKFFVLYNGHEKTPDYSVLHLSDAYISKEERAHLDLEVKLYNINAEIDPKIIAMSDSLRQYSLFVHQVNVEREQGKELGEAIRDAIAFCRNNDIMKQFLEENGSEVTNMLFSEWDMDRALQVQREEGARQEFLRVVKNMRNAKMEPKQIAVATGHTIEDVESAIAEIEKGHN